MLPFFSKKTPKNLHLKGRKEEHLVAQFLQRHHLKLITQNYHCRFGEIDLIMLDQRFQDDTLVFIEVKARKKDAQVSALDAISPQKINRIIKTAQHFLSTYDEMPNCRFDVVAVTYEKSVSKTTDKDYNIEWIESAFTY